jgi:hypothetical protein
MITGVYVFGCYGTMSQPGFVLVFDQDLDMVPLTFKERLSVATKTIDGKRYARIITSNGDRSWPCLGTEPFKSYEEMNRWIKAKRTRT